VTALRPDHATVAYEALAPGYDVLTREHDHGHWTALLEAKALEAGLRGQRLLDVGCGTGNTIVPMIDRGYEVTGVDVSSAMLAEASRKLGSGARLVIGDMRDLPVLGEFDLVWALGDALNYLQSEAELARAFFGFRQNLSADGVVVVDVNTLATFRTTYTSRVAVPAEDRVITLEGHGSRDVASGGTATAVIDRLERQPSGEWRRVRSEHHHRHHPEREMRRALADAGLECIQVYGTQPTGVIEAPMDELRHAKAVYIARASAH
jgi:SAM-dependent methyltransferase